MPKVIGLFDDFKDLDQIPVDDITRWIKPTPNLIVLQNSVANRILYPQAIPVTQQEMEIDLALLREALKRDSRFILANSRKIIIPQDFILRISDLKMLTWVFIDAYLLDKKGGSTPQVWTVIKRSQRDQVIGSIILPDLKGGELSLNVAGKVTVVKKGGLTLIPCSSDKCQIEFKIIGGQIFGMKEGKVEVYGGNLGLMVDTR